MGIESQYLGEINIPEEHRAEYAQQALKLLRAGGMVTVESVQLYGHKLYLLSPPELDEEDGKAVGHYNYLDENSGEQWCLNAKDGWFGCGKIIGSCYYSTIAAVHILTTLWSNSYAATLINGCLVREKTYIRWINYVLGTQYTNQRATQLWEIGKLLQLDDAYWVRCNPDLGYLLEDYPPECADRDHASQSWEMRRGVTAEAAFIRSCSTPGLAWEALADYCLEHSDELDELAHTGTAWAGYPSDWAAASDELMDELLGVLL